VTPRFRDRFLILWLAGFAAAFLVLPYAFALQRAALEQVQLPLPVLVLASAAQTAVLLAVAVLLGLRAADAVGLRTPLTDALAFRRGVGEAFASLGPVRAAVIGALAGSLIIGLDVLVFAPLLGPGGMPAVEAPGRLAGLLASFYGGITEELLMRLLLVSGIAWILRGRAMWIAIVLAALVFGVGHLPTLAVIGPLTALGVARAIVLNTVGGIAFGWLYWRRGLEAAMIAHFAAGIVLHVLVTI